MMNNKKLIAIAAMAITLGIFTLSGCGASSSEVETTTAAVSSDTSVETAETTSEAEVLETTVSETSTTPETTETSEETTAEPLTSAETEPFEEDEEIPEAVTVTFETAPTPEYELTKPAAAGESPVFAENYKQWSVATEKVDTYNTPDITHTAVGKDIYADLFANSTSSDIVKIEGTCDSCKMSSTIKLPENAELSEYRYIENGEYSYFEQGATYTVKGENYSLNVAFGFITYHYDDEGDVHNCVFKDVHDYIDSLGLETYEYSRVNPQFSMHGDDFDDTIFDKSVTENIRIHEAVMTVDNNSNTKTMYIMIPVEPGSDLLLQIKLEDNYSDFNADDNEPLSDSAFVCLCTELLVNFKY